MSSSSFWVMPGKYPSSARHPFVVRERAAMTFSRFCDCTAGSLFDAENELCDWGKTQGRCLLYPVRQARRRGHLRSSRSCSGRRLPHTLFRRLHMKDLLLHGFLSLSSTRLVRGYDEATRGGREDGALRRRGWKDASNPVDAGRGRVARDRRNQSSPTGSPQPCQSSVLTQAVTRHCGDEPPGGPTTTDYGDC